MECLVVSDREVHRVGYDPAPWEWTPWEYAHGGRFDGRWDDPGGNWRALYVGECALVCYLEVLAPFRPDPTLVQEMADIVSEDNDEQLYPTAKSGELPFTWCEPRLRCSGRLSGCFALPGHSTTLPTLRKQFLELAKTQGCEDLDAGAIRHGHREITQSISAWIYLCKGIDDDPVSGVQYLSRHGDEFTLWAIYERDTKHSSPPQITEHATHQRITPEDPDLVHAMQIHGIVWGSD